jgi:hypothetical protein
VSASVSVGDVFEDTETGETWEVWANYDIFAEGPTAECRNAEANAMDTISVDRLLSSRYRRLPQAGGDDA